MGDSRAPRARRVLMVAYFFPPLGGAGVQRSLKFAKYLPGEGWDPTVITVGSRDYWMADATLADELGPRVSVRRTASVTGIGLLRRLAPRQAGRPGQARSSARGMGLLRRMAAWILVPDSYRGWVPFAVRGGHDELLRRRHDLIYTTSSPDSAHLVGRELAQRSGLPWVADFRDPWTRRMSFQPPTRWHRRVQRRLEERVLREATLVTVTAEETRQDFLRLYPDLAPHKIQVITNGFDEEDFTPWAHLRPSDDRLRILHAGQLNPERPERPFLEGLRRFLDAAPERRDRLAVRFIGPHYASDRRSAAALGLEDVVRFAAGRPHAEVIAELMRSHILLLMEQDSGRGGLILPGKVFEYLRAGRPILGLLPPGAAWNLIARLGVGRCCRTEDADSVAGALDEFYQRFRAGTLLEGGLAAEDCRAFERATLTRRLAGQFDRIVEGVS